MNHKVLLADDSLTIQKVIKITLANQPFDIVDCSTDEELFKKLPEVQPKIVFLDFNLSEKYTGYELTSKIRSIVPSASVLLLLGTFDSVDDAAMEKCGAADKVVKPFDSNKFIAICKRLADTEPLKEIEFPKDQGEKTDSFAVPVDEEDQWQVKHELKAESPVQAEPVSQPTSSLNLLDQEVSDWGMMVPGIIDGGKADHPEFPPVIGEVKSLGEHRSKLQESKLPQENDLDYPTVEELEKSAKPAETNGTSSKLLSIDNFNFQSDGNFTVEHTINQNEDTDISKIEAQIKDEVEENLWQVDEYEGLKKEVSAKIEEVKSNFQPSINDFDESLFKPLDENETIQWNVTEPKREAEVSVQPMTAAPAANFDHAEMEEMVKKYVREYMDEMFKKNVEKVAWDVIPDLAENLIRQEISKISHKLLNESK